MIKVVLYGPESTGKTTLAKDLAAHFKTEWVPEYMRIYLEEKWQQYKELISKDDLIPIAKGQLALEKEVYDRVNNLLICDTNLLELKVYSEYYYDGYCPQFIREKADQLQYEIYFLTYIDIPWEEDILRDRPHNREEMFCIFESELKKMDLPYQILKGSRENRLEEAIKTIHALMENSTLR